MGILCALFGHKSLENEHGGAEYMKLRLGPVDGIGRVHTYLLAECPRCGETYNAGKIHLPEIAISNRNLIRAASSVVVSFNDPNISVAGVQRQINMLEKVVKENSVA